LIKARASAPLSCQNCNRNITQYKLDPIASVYNVDKIWKYPYLPFYLQRPARF